jgi:hypothetical protein
MTSPSPASPLEVVEPSLSLPVGTASFNSNSPLLVVAPVPLPTKKTSSSDSSSTLAFSTLASLLQLLLKVLYVVKEVATQHLQLELLQGFVLDAAVHGSGCQGRCRPSTRRLLTLGPRRRAGLYTAPAGPLRLLSDLLERWLTCWPPSSLLLPVPVPSSRGFPTTVSTLDAVSKPAGGYSPAAEGKLGKVPHEEKTSVVYVFLL